ncbi:MAG: penicillin-binding transpeptidase domain-containing protein [Chitinophagaceae bacterium]
MIKWLIAACAIPVVFTACSPNNVTEDKSLQKYFDENHLTGSFGLLDNGQGQFTIYNTVRFSDSTYLPGSTFNIINSLVGIEAGAVNDTSSVITADSGSVADTVCGKDLTMRQAFKMSCTNWYRELARRIGKPVMQRWLDTLGYARRYDTLKIQNNLDSFWLDNSTRITADEQLGLIKKLYFDQLPFQQRSQRLVRSMLLQESNANYSLNYQVAAAKTPDGRTIGWLAGWIEENVHPYFFILQTESADPSIDLEAMQKKMLKDILKQYGFMEGKK